MKKHKHIWYYDYHYEMPNGYEYEWIRIPIRICKICGLHQELNDSFGDVKKRWRNINS